MDYGERKFNARSEYSTQYTSRMGTVRIKQEEETDTRIVRNLEERNVGMNRKIPKTRPN